jgi:N-acetyl-anhydromuramyl-L-alanine amidase AmpD
MKILTITIAVMLAVVISTAQAKENQNFMKEFTIEFVPLNKHFKGNGQAKTQIVLHHTVGGGKPTPVVEYWDKYVTGRVGTHFVIGKNGEIVQTMDLQDWASHVNCDGKGNVGNGKQVLDIERRTIGIELCAWGGLVEYKGKFYTSYGVKPQNIIEEDKVYRCDFRGFKAYDRYSEPQLLALKQLLVFLGNTLSLDITKTCASNFELSDKAHAQEMVVCSHTNFRKDKSDVFPQPELIDLLQSL